VDDCVVGNEKGRYWLSNDVAELVVDFPFRNGSRSLYGTSRGCIYLGLTENKRGYISC